MDIQGQDGGRISDVDGQGVVGCENSTIFMDVMCVPNCLCIIFKVLSLAGKISEKRKEKKLLVEIKTLLIKSLKMYFLFETA